MKKPWKIKGNLMENQWKINGNSNEKITENQEIQNLIRIQNLVESKINVQVELASGGKCLRCWKVVNEVKDDIEICYRCTSVLKNS